jgi:hypothetical protein
MRTVYKVVILTRSPDGHAHYGSASILRSNPFHRTYALGNRVRRAFCFYSEADAKLFAAPKSNTVLVGEGTNFRRLPVASILPGRAHKRAIGGMTEEEIRSFWRRVYRGGKAPHKSIFHAPLGTVVCDFKATGVVR